MASAVVFDLFHTLVDTEHLRPPAFDEIAAIAATAGIEESLVRRAWRDGYTERETTTVEPTDQLCDALESSGHPISAATRREADRLLGITRDQALLSPEPAIVAMVTELAEVHPLAVLSNCHEREIREWPQSPLAPLIAHFVASSRIGVMKPRVEAYLQACDRLGVPARRCVFVGNGSSDELAGARAAGFATIVHANHFDRSNGLVSPAEQRARSRQADTNADTIDELRSILRRLGR